MAVLHRFYCTGWNLKFWTPIKEVSFSWSETSKTGFRFATHIIHLKFYEIPQCAFKKCILKPFRLCHWPACQFYVVLQSAQGYNLALAILLQASSFLLNSRGNYKHPNSLHGILYLFKPYGISHLLSNPLLRVLGWYFSFISMISTTSESLKASLHLSAFIFFYEHSKFHAPLSWAWKKAL